MLLNCTNTAIHLRCYLQVITVTAKRCFSEIFGQADKKLRFSCCTALGCEVFYFCEFPSLHFLLEVLYSFYIHISQQFSA